MLPYRESRIGRWVIGIFFLVVFGYATFELRGILQGPVITLTPRQASVDTAFVTISGTARRISSLSMNGEAVSVTETGVFAEPYLLAPGLNLIVLEARDKYGRRTRLIDRLVYSPIAKTVGATTTIAN